MGGERAPAASPQRDDRLVECVAGAFPIRSTLYAASERRLPLGMEGTHRSRERTGRALGQLR
jgi:hypothetical protein